MNFDVTIYVDITSYLPNYSTTKKNFPLLNRLSVKDAKSNHILRHMTS